ncbi:MAG: S49 family peptidase [Bacteroidales bacterium]|nr:S49 family peptidase [Bacteroidales bacterium]
MPERHRIPNNFQLALSLLRGRWLLADAESLLPHALNFLAHNTVETETFGYEPLLFSAEGEAFFGDGSSERSDSKKKKVAVIPMHGALTKYWGCSTVGCQDVAAEIMALSAREDVVGFVLDIDSPGGASNAVPPMTAAIKHVQKIGKPIVAHCDFCASAAYWIASQCDAVFMDNIMSEVGSIGAYASYLDDRENRQTGEKVVAVYAKESPDKNKAYREALEGKYEVCQEELSALVHMFHKAVKDARPTIKSDEPGVFTGATFFTPKAVDLNMADAMMSLEDCIQNVFIRAEYK